MQQETTITFLGTSSVTPAGGHDTASFLINGRYLVDTGWYAAVKMQCYGFSPLDLEYVFITHCHHDHYMGMPALLFHLAMRGRDRPAAPPLKVIGPAEDIARVVRLSRGFLQQKRFPDAAHVPDIIPLEPGESYEDPAFRLDTCASLHPVQALCYRFTDKHTGAVFAFTGDTAYSPAIVEHVRGVPLLIHEASHGAAPAPSPNSWGHSGAPDAARVAREAGVGRLALVHCAEAHQQGALAAAQAIFPNTIWPADGETVTVDRSDGVAE